MNLEYQRKLPQIQQLLLTSWKEYNRLGRNVNQPVAGKQQKRKYYFLGGREILIFLGLRGLPS
jgi:hypothetical protein